jgi:S-(hydroxymethyl)glutathione dehydrogenase / alcohol dehydrogenase
VSARTVTGCVHGSADPDVDFPRLVDLYRSGALDLDRLVTRRIGLDDLEDAFARMQAGDGARSVIVFD